jgi:hypothetical protein
VFQLFQVFHEWRASMATARATGCSGAPAPYADVAPELGAIPVDHVPADDDGRLGCFDWLYDWLPALRRLDAAAEQLGMGRPLYFDLLAKLRRAVGPSSGLPGWAGTRAAYRDLLDAIAAHRVADRPNRYEPRVKKRRRNHYGWLTRPRAEMRRRMAKSGTEK